MTRSRPQNPDVDLSSLGLSDVPADNPTSYARRDLYELRQTLESGIGTFATAVIPSGTRIICEERLLMLPDNAGHIDLHRVVKALPEDRQALYWDLAASSKPSTSSGWMDMLRACTDDDISEGWDAVIQEYELAWSIYKTNRFTCKTLDGAKKGLGLFPLSARLNHSCVPNVFHRYSPSIDRLTIHALRDIQPGEELFTSYIDICHPTVKRQQMLNHWGFRCGCTACESSDTEEDSRRKGLEDIFVRIGNREKKRLQNESKWKKEDYERSFSVVANAIELLEKEGMEETDTLGIVYTLGVRLAIRVGKEEDAVKWAENTVEIERKCLGDDSREYQQAVELLDMAKKAKAEAESPL
ncbi:hypothetical protein ABW20_dc0108873 [Dactylellina cionopaga]|nr:hypothetical protein ABW20_dc0108873 [Dactylellina cionopaga]